MYIYTCMYIYTHTQICIYYDILYIYFTYCCMYVCTHIYALFIVCLRVCVCVCVCVRLFIVFIVLFLWQGGNIWITDCGNHCVRLLTPLSRHVSTLYPNPLALLGLFSFGLFWGGAHKLSFALAAVLGLFVCLSKGLRSLALSRSLCNLSLYTSYQVDYDVDDLPICPLSLARSLARARACACPLSLFLSLSLSLYIHLYSICTSIYMCVCVCLSVCVCVWLQEVESVGQ